MFSFQCYTNYLCAWSPLFLDVRQRCTRPAPKHVTFIEDSRYWNCSTCSQLDSAVPEGRHGNKTCSNRSSAKFCLSWCLDELVSRLYRWADPDGDTAEWRIAYRLRCALCYLYRHLLLDDHVLCDSSNTKPANASERSIPSATSNTSKLRHQHGSTLEAVKNVVDLAQTCSEPFY